MLVPFSNKISEVQKLLESYVPEQCFLLYDENTIRHCDTIIRHLLPTLNNSKRIIIAAGDESKSIEKCMTIWDTLVVYSATKKALLINVGGGMISDIGGFCAASYKRGIDFINIPTSLLGMVDASIGSKTGVNLRNSKNQIGAFADAKYVYYNCDFLETLPRPELISGIAEMLKHELLFNENALETILQRAAKKDWITEEAIRLNVLQKMKIVRQDYYDRGVRQCLNFGHTIGHGIEAYSHAIKTPILHGEAVMLGMIEELKLSEKLFDCPVEIRIVLESFKLKFFPLLDIKYNLEKIMPFLLQDKKNDKEIRFSLLEDVAKPKLQVAVSIDQMTTALV